MTLLFEYLIATESVQVPAVEHALGMLAAGDRTEDILAAYGRIIERDNLKQLKSCKELNF